MHRHFGGGKFGVHSDSFLDWNDGGLGKHNLKFDWDRGSERLTLGSAESQEYFMDCLCSDGIIEDLDRHGDLNGALSSDLLRDGLSKGIHGDANL